MQATSFTFCSYKIDTERSIVTFSYRVEFAFGLHYTFTDSLVFKGVPSTAWAKIPKEVLEPTLQALLLMLGINYWSFFRAKDIRIEGFTLTCEQAHFWDTLYLNGLAEFFYLAKIDFRNLIAFPYSETVDAPHPIEFKRPSRSLLLNGAGKDSILSAEMLKEQGRSFDFFAFSPTRAHHRIAKLVGAKSIEVERRYDPLLKSFVTGAYPSVSTFTFIAVLLAELLGYDSIVFSNERSADIGNLDYLGLPVNHQWCKSSEAEKLINDYLQRYITRDITTSSLLRPYSELAIVQRFVRYPQYHHYVTSCNTYFWLSPLEQFFAPTNYWCKRCPKCVFLFACFAAFLPKKEVVSIFRGNVHSKKHLLPLYKSILGIEGFKPLDCVGEPEEMILAMHYALERGEYGEEPAMKLFTEHFPNKHDYASLEKKVFTDTV